MSETTSGIDTVTSQPVPAIPGVEPGNFIVTIFTIKPLKRSARNTEQQTQLLNVSKEIVEFSFIE